MCRKCPDLAAVHPRVGCVQTAEGAGVFFPHSAPPRLQDRYNLNQLAFILIAEHIEVRQVQQERRYWA